MIAMRGCRFPARPAAAGALALAGLLLLPTVALPVTVSPTALYIDGRSRTATLTLYNGGTRPEEVEITFAFGYAVSDALGSVRVVFMDSISDDEPSVVPFLRAFPQRVRLAPGQRQVVRVLVSPPEGLAEGEYWGRVLVNSTGGQPPVEQAMGDVRVQFQIRSVFAVAVNYRHGRVRTGVMMHDARTAAAPDTVRLFLDMERVGNAAFLGRVRAEVLDARGAVIASAVENVAVYRRILWRVDIPLAGDRERREPHSVRYTLEAERPEEAAGHILDAPPSSGGVPVAARAPVLADPPAGSG